MRASVAAAVPIATRHAQPRRSRQRRGSAARDEAGASAPLPPGHLRTELCQRRSAWRPQYGAARGTAQARSADRFGDPTRRSGIAHRYSHRPRGKGVAGSRSAAALALTTRSASRLEEVGRAPPTTAVATPPPPPRGGGGGGPPPPRRGGRLAG